MTVLLVIALGMLAALAVGGACELRANYARRAAAETQLVDETVAWLRSMREDQP